MKSKRLPDTEFEIMDYIWDEASPITTSMVMDKIGKARGWKIQTVVSLFARLAERGFLRAEKGVGRERDFYPLVSREAYLQMETSTFVSHYHKGSCVSLFNALQSEKITDAELDELSEWLRQRREDGQ